MHNCPIRIQKIRGRSVILIFFSLVAYVAVSLAYYSLLASVWLVSRLGLVEEVAEFIKFSFLFVKSYGFHLSSIY